MRSENKVWRLEFIELLHKKKSYIKNNRKATMAFLSKLLGFPPTSLKDASRCTSDYKLPLGVKECVIVCVHGMASNQGCFYSCLTPIVLERGSRSTATPTSIKKLLKIKKKERIFSKTFQNNVISIMTEIRGGDYSLKSTILERDNVSVIPSVQKIV